MLSRIRANIPDKSAEPALPAEPELKAYEVFIQLKRSEPHVHAGSLDAPDDEVALEFAREHYARDQQCVHIWVVPRAAIVATDYDKDLVWRNTDQSYRLARGYQDVRKKWEKFRKKKDVDEYQKLDLKEGF
ncbi:MAG TPA: phenylacetic acid degradation protein [Phycisphaerae bacterium]|jgi:ring-1,2-phenylacetyl-CoA epoxidase subunit PaaB